MSAGGMGATGTGTRRRGRSGSAVLAVPAAVLLLWAVMPAAAGAQGSCTDPTDPVVVQPGDQDACAQYVAISNQGDATAGSKDTVVEAESFRNTDSGTTAQIAD